MKGQEKRRFIFAQGLETHPDKTKILTNQKTNRQNEIEIDEMHVEILPSEGKVKYLVQMITFVDHETTERRNTESAVLGLSDTRHDRN